MKNICIQNPIPTYAIISIVGGITGSVAYDILKNVDEEQEKEYVEGTLAIPTPKQAFKQIFSQLGLSLSLLSTIGLGSESLCNAVRPDTIFSIPSMTLPLYLLSFWGTSKVLTNFKL